MKGRLAMLYAAHIVVTLLAATGEAANIVNEWWTGRLPGFRMYELDGSPATYDFWQQFNYTQVAQIAGTENIPSDCGGDYTGGHYDPTLACGPASGNPNCPADRSSYKCTPETYMVNPASCEYGDLSGKFGPVFPYKNNNGNSGYVYVRDTDYGMPAGEKFDGMSIVFHCGNTGQRAFCGLIKSVSGVWPPAEGTHGFEE